MKKITVILDDTLEKIVEKDSLSNQLTISEIVRRRLTEAYHSQAKQEEKVVKAFEVFERKLIETIEEKFSKIEIQNVRSLSYILSNHHLLKVILRDVLFAELPPEKQTTEIRDYVSYAKGLALKVHPVDSVNSKENITSNIFPEHLS